MRPNTCKTKVLFGSVVVIVLIFGNCLAGHHKDDDDDDEDDDPQCYPGRNCRPGCYCTGSYCRAYFPPHNQYLKRYQCTGYNYPKWKLWKKGSKQDGRNSTAFVVLAHHYEKSAPSITTYLTKNNYTTYDIYEPPIPIEKSSVRQSHLESSSVLSSKNNPKTVVDLIVNTTSVYQLQQPTSNSTGTGKN